MEGLTPISHSLQFFLWVLPQKMLHTFLPTSATQELVLQSLPSVQIKWSCWTFLFCLSSWWCCSNIISKNHASTMGTNCYIPIHQGNSSCDAVVYTLLKRCISDIWLVCVLLDNLEEILSYTPLKSSANGNYWQFFFFRKSLHEHFLVDLNIRALQINYYSRE